MERPDIEEYSEDGPDGYIPDLEAYTDYLETDYLSLQAVCAILLVIIIFLCFAIGVLW